MAYSVPIIYTSWNDSATFIRQTDGFWSVPSSTTPIEQAELERYGAITENGDINVGELLGAGSQYYLPMLTNRTGDYFIGADDAYGDGFTATSGRIDVAMWRSRYEDSSILGLYDFNDNKVYKGFSNTFGFGSFGYTRDDGTIVSSNQTIVEFTKPVSPLVIENVQFPAWSDFADSPIHGGDSIIVVLAELNDAGDGYANEYYAYITAESCVANDQAEGLFAVTAYFVENIDGFELSINPVIKNAFDLYLIGFNNENVSMGIPMAFDETASGDGEFPGDYPSHSTIDVYYDGQLMGYMQDQRTEAAISLAAYYNYLGFGASCYDYNAVVPAEGGDAIFDVEDDVLYGGVAVFTTFDVDDPSGLGPDFANIEIEYDTDEDWISEIQVDNSKYEDYGYVVLAVAATPYTGSDERNAVLSIATGDGASTIRVHVKQGETLDLDHTGAASGIEKIVISPIADKAAKNGAIYDLYGRQIKSAAEGQLYIQNGKIIRK